MIPGSERLADRAVVPASQTLRILQIRSRTLNGWPARMTLAGRPALGPSLRHISTAFPVSPALPGRLLPARSACSRALRGPTVKEPSDSEDRRQAARSVLDGGGESA